MQAHKNGDFDGISEVTNYLKKKIPPKMVPLVIIFHSSDFSLQKNVHWTNSYFVEYGSWNSNQVIDKPLQFLFKFGVPEWVLGEHQIISALVQLDA